MTAADGTITVGGVTYDVTLTARPGAGSTPSPQSRRQRMLWDYGWEPLNPGALPPDVLSSLTHVSAFVCQSQKPGTGRLRPPAGFDRAKVEAYRAAGVKVDLCIGGAGDGGITVTTVAQANELIASIKVQVAACGYTGVDLDLEPSGGKWSRDAILRVCRAAIGDGLEVHVTSALYDEWTDAWGQVVRDLGPSLASWRVMLYDFREAVDSRLTGVTLDKLRTMRGYLAREDQMVACYATGGAIVSSPTSVIRDAYATAHAAYPLAGWGVWQGDVERSRGWSGVRTLAGI